MEHIWTVICEKAILDNETKNLSLIQTLEQIKFALVDDTNEKIFVPIEFYVVTLWMRSDLDEPEKNKAKVELFSPERESLASYEYDIDLSQYPRFRRKQRVQGFPFTTSGIYRFQLNILDNTTQEWVEVSSTPLQVIRDFPSDMLEEIKNMEMNQ